MKKTNFILTALIIYLFSANNHLTAGLSLGSRSLSVDITLQKEIMMSSDVTCPSIKFEAQQTNIFGLAMMPKNSEILSETAQQDLAPYQLCLYSASRNGYDITIVFSFKQKYRITVNSHDGKERYHIKSSGNVTKLDPGLKFSVLMEANGDKVSALTTSKIDFTNDGLTIPEIYDSNRNVSRSTVLPTNRKLRVYVVGDSLLYSVHGEDAVTLMSSIMTEANSIYKNEINIEIIVEKMVIWKTEDLAEVSFFDHKETVLNFAKYFYYNPLAGDVIHLITQQSYGDLLGIAYTGGACDPRLKSGFTSVNSGILKLNILTLVHGLGHNMGLKHLNDNCQCSQEACIMSSSPPIEVKDYGLRVKDYGFSDCAKNQLKASWLTGTLQCLDSKDYYVATGNPGGGSGGGPYIRQSRGEVLAVFLLMTLIF